jgi:predicted transcriptional regulator
MLADRLRHPPAAPLDVLLSIKPPFADGLARGHKRVEFRRRFPRHVTSGRAVVYVTAPVQAITLTATITRVVRAAPAALWDAYCATAGVDRAEFDVYFDGLPTGVALLLDDVRPVRPPLRLDDPRLRHAGFRPPQSLTVLETDSAIAKALAGV